MRRIGIFCSMGFMMILALAVRPAQAQDDPNFETGLVSYGAYNGGQIDNINLLNGGLGLEIPLISYPQRGNLKLGFSLLYQNGSYYGDVECDDDGCYTDYSVTNPNFFLQDTGGTYLLPGSCELDLYPDFFCPPSLIVDGTGASHMIGVNTSTWRTIDTSNYSGTYDAGPFNLPRTTTSGGIVDSQGTAYSYTGFDSTHCPGTPSYYGGSVYIYLQINFCNAGSGFLDRTDVYGNSISVSGTSGWIDSLSRSIPVPTSRVYSSVDDSDCTGPMAYSTTNSAFVVLWSPPGVEYANGGRSDGTYPLKFCYFWTTAYPPYPILQSVVLPNETTWTFSYTTDGNYNLASVTLPAGGSISYTWGTTNPCDDGHTGGAANSAVLTRTVNPNYSSSSDPTGEWQYSYPSSGAGDTIVTEPSGDESVHSMGGCFPYENSASYYTGSHTSGTLVKGVSTSYSSTGLTWLAPYTVYVAVAPSLVETTWYSSSSVHSAVAYTYDSGFTSYQPDYYVSGGIYTLGTSPSTAYTVSYGKQTAKQEYDFGSSSYGSLIRQTLTSYMFLSGTYSSYYLGNNLVDLPSSVKVEDSGSTQRAYTTYGYDESSYASSGCSSTTPCGELTSIANWLNTTSGYLTSHIYYESGGLLLKTMDPIGNYPTSYTYSTTSCASGSGYAGSGPTTVTNAKGQVTSYCYDLNTGLMTSTTDPNSQTTTLTYDLMSRLTSESATDGASVTYTYNDSTPSVTFSKKITSSTSFQEVGIVDGVGRSVQTQTTVPSTTCSSGPVYANTSYDGNGRKVKVYNPSCSSSGALYTQYSYDGLDRPTTVTEQDGSTVTVDYSLFPKITATDEAEKKRTISADGLGRMTTVWEDPSTLNYETDYSYDTLDNLLQVQQKGGSSSSSNWRTRTFTYDSLSRLVCAANPEIQSVTCPTSATSSFPAGSVQYGYDADSNVTSKIAPQPNQSSASTSVTISYSYDSLNRLLQKSYSDSTPTVKYVYDTDSLPSGCSVGSFSFSGSLAIGLLKAMCDGAGSDAFSYANVSGTGTSVTDQRITSSITKQFTNTYYYDGSLYSIAYPDGTIGYGVNPAEQPTSAVDTTNSINYVPSSGGATYAPHGGLSALPNGSSLNSTLIYNSRLQPCWFYITTGTALPTGTSGTTCSTSDPGPGNVMDLQYNFNLGTADNGNVMGITNNINSNRSQTYTYDALNRIYQAYTSGSLWGETYQIDAWGNMHEEDAYSTKPQPDTLSMGVATNNQFTSLSYDAAGNLENDGTNGYYYDAENRICSVGGTSCTSGSVYYSYDGGGNRVQKSSGKLYWYGLSGSPLLETDSSGNLTDEYVFFGGQRIARKDSSGNVDYYFVDHLSSTRVVSNASGTVQDDIDYTPYGTEAYVASSSSGNDYLFTGKERDSETGLDNFGARYFSHQYGRFMQTDPGNAGANPSNPQSWNMYSYVLNNPLKLTDPTGTDPEYTGNCAMKTDVGVDDGETEPAISPADCEDNEGGDPQYVSSTPESQLLGPSQRAAAQSSIATAPAGQCGILCGILGGLNAWATSGSSSDDHSNDMAALDAGGSGLNLGSLIRSMQQTQSPMSSCQVAGKVTGTAQGAGQAGGYGKPGALGFAPPIGSVAIDPAALGLKAGTGSTNARLKKYAPRITFAFDPAPKLPQGFPTNHTVGDVVDARKGPLIFDIQGFATIKEADAATVQSAIVTITYPSAAGFTCAPIQ